MKPAFVFFLACCFSMLTATAQTHWGTRVQTSKIVVRLNGEKHWQPLDWHAFVLAETNLGADFWLQPELGFGTRHTVYHSRSRLSSHTFDYNLFKVQTNLLCKYLVDMGNWKTFPYAGLTTDYVVSGQVHFYGWAIQYQAPLLSIDQTMHLGFDSYKYKRFTYGPIFGVSLQIPVKSGSFVFDVRCSTYSLSVIPCEGCDAKEGSFSLGAGYIFGAGN